MLNQCNFMGRVGKSPELRVTQSGTKVASFSVACSEKFKDRNGQQQETTEWVNCTAFGNKNGDGLAGVIERFVKKGDLIYVSGKMKTEKYQAQDGSDRYTTKIIVNDMKMIPTGNSNSSSGTDSGNSGASGGSSGGYGSQGGYGSGPQGAPDLDDEIPF